MSSVQQFPEQQPTVLGLHNASDSSKL